MMICFLSIPAIFAKPHSYSGSMNVFSKGENLLALHEYGIKYNAIKHQILTFSNLEILDLKRQTKSIIQKSPRLVAMKWTENLHYLIGISTLMVSDVSQLFIFDRAGNLRGDLSINCDVRGKSFFLLFREFGL